MPANTGIIYVTELAVSASVHFIKALKTASAAAVPITAKITTAIMLFTPDSFSDGGKFDVIENALAQTQKLIKEGD